MSATLPHREAINLDPIQSAKVAGLKYTTDRRAGIKRKRAGKRFIYEGPDGKPIRNRSELRRIKSLGIPPAWTEVWICPDPLGHLQATGRDAKRRKQYRYHPRWREVRDETKYDKMLAFGKALPLIRKRVEHDLSLPGLPREKMLATVVRLLEVTLIRVGNEEYARENSSFGLTTFRTRHVAVRGSKMVFKFRGKSGKRHIISIDDPRLARIVKRCQDLPGQELFQYLDSDEQRRTLDSDDVNEYLGEITGQDFTAKDFRTWAGTILTAVALQDFGPCESPAQAKKSIVAAIQSVADRLGNTPTICRKCYVHPDVLAAYMEGTVAGPFALKAGQDMTDPSLKLRPVEASVMKLLEQRLEKE